MEPVESKSGIVERDRRRKIHVERANQMFAVDVEIGERRLVVWPAISRSSVRLVCCTRGVTKLGANAETSLVTP